MKLLDLFQKQNKSKRIIKKMKQGKLVNIVCFGDSITWGHELKSYITKKETKDNYPINLEKILRNFYKNNNINVYNEGHDGWTAEKAIKNKNGLEYIISLNADLIIVMFGINEVISFPRVDIDVYKKSIDFIIKELNKTGVDILVLSPTPIHVMDKALVEYSKIVLDLAKSNKVYSLNMRNLLSDYINNNNLKKYQIIGIDNVHFWSNKYKIISEILFKNFFI